jgi:hypothetical protein
MSGDPGKLTVFDFANRLVADAYHRTGRFPL